MKHKVFGPILLLLTMFALQGAVAQTIDTTKHNLSTGTYNQVCVYCHTPHSQSPTTVLWNRDSSLAAYSVYTSPTMEQTPTAPTTGISANCLSCHDGTMGYDNILNVPGSGPGTPGNTPLMTGWPMLGEDLTNDHPVHMIYNTSYTTDGDLRAPTLDGTKVVVTDGTNTLPLYGTTTANGYLECGSCHDPHDDTHGTFLRMSNAGSDMCQVCHTK